MRFIHPRFLLPACLALASSPALAADSWTNQAEPTVRVHGHTFDKVRIESSGCEVKLQLWFDAPADAYADKRNVVRNYYRFIAKVAFKDGRTLETKTFGNRAPGARVHTTTLDTSGDGCWSKTKNQIIKLDVNACRGTRCVVDRFE